MKPAYLVEVHEWYLHDGKINHNPITEKKLFSTRDKASKYAKSRYNQLLKSRNDIRETTEGVGGGIIFYMNDESHAISIYQLDVE